MKIHEYVKTTSSASGQAANKVLNSLFRTNGDDVFTPSPCTSLVPLGPLFSSSPSTSISINSEGPESLTIDSYARRWPSMVIRSRSRSMSFEYTVSRDDC
jgi:hypothetical protein